MDAGFDERISLVSLLLAGLNTRFAAARAAGAVTDACYQQLRSFKRALGQQAEADPADLFAEQRDRYRERLEADKSAGSLLPDDLSGALREGLPAFGRKLAAQLAGDGVDCSLLCFTDAFPTPVVFTGADTALPYRAHSAGLALGPEQLEAAPFREASAFCFSSAGLVDSPLRLAHLEALAAARDAGALCCYLPRLAQAAPYWPQREALCQTSLQFLDRADVLFLEESDLLLLFGSRELRTALFALFTGHVQLIFFYKKDRILAFTRSVMASAAKKDQSPALVLYRMEQMGIHVIDLPQLREHVLGQLLSNDANTTECQGLPY